jgi:glycosyltransferase involved in cell wall biosynthesis
MKYMLQNYKIKLCDIVIPTKNRSSILNRCIKSIFSNSFNSEFFNLIISDNNSSDDTKDVLNQFKDRDDFFVLNQTIDLTGWENLYSLIDFSQSKYIFVLSDHAHIEDNSIFQKLISTLNNDCDLYFVPTIVENQISNFELNKNDKNYNLGYFDRLLISNRFYFSTGQIVSKSLLNTKYSSLKYNSYPLFYFYIVNLNTKGTIVRVNSLISFKSFKMNERNWSYNSNGLLFDKLHSILILNNLLLKNIFIFKLLWESKSIIPHVKRNDYRNTLKRISPVFGILFYFMFYYLYKIKFSVNKIRHLF